LHPGHYILNTVTLDDAGANPAGSYLTCKDPKKQRIVTGGSFWHQSGQGPDPGTAFAYELGSSAATFDAKGWYADGFSFATEQLTITALCLPKSQVGPYTLRTRTLNVAAHNAAGGSVKCPLKQRIVTGGAFWHQPGLGPDPSNAVNDHLGSSNPTLNGKGWYADGATSVASRLTITALCLPESQVGSYTLKKKTFTPSVMGGTGGYLKCPKNQRIVGGGAFWHRAGKGPAPRNAKNSFLGSSTATFDAKGWYADGDGRTGSQLTVVAQCLPT
jgi:hypothetical protein